MSAGMSAPRQKSMQRPFFSQSPYRVGSGPPRPPISGGDAGGSAGDGPAWGSVGGTVSPMIRGSLAIR